MTTTDEPMLRERREAVVREHMEAENRHDVEAAIATFHSARYEVNGQPSEGESAVRDLLNEMMSGFPDFRAVPERLRHTDDAVVLEGRITGTHEGAFAGIPATGRSVDYPLVAIFEFEADRLLCEKIYFDSATILRQIGVLPADEAG